jgi:two-component system alkaline phosphatase synthesis response regulator PhoP
MEKTPKILIVDDDPDFVQSTSMALRSKPYDVVVAYNGEVGVSKAKSEQPDIVLLDIMMPVMDGFTAAHKFATDPALSGIPVIALTSFSESLGQPFEFEFAAYVRKPVRAKDLIEIIERHLNKPGAASP